ncbi:MAG: T9SS type A sorting domain-containing protein [Sphingobacteriales bacterium]|nr:MAG: T9SS type A sorting domain-containing protein [Sphingobacteriales bacterium]
MIRNLYAILLGLLCLFRISNAHGQAQVNNWTYGAPVNYLYSPGTLYNSYEKTNLNPSGTVANNTGYLAWADKSDGELKIASVFNQLSQGDEFATGKPPITTGYKTYTSPSMFEYEGDAYVSFMTINNYNQHFLQILRININGTTELTTNINLLNKPSGVAIAAAKVGGTGGQDAVAVVMTDLATKQISVLCLRNSNPPGVKAQFHTINIINGSIQIGQQTEYSPSACNYGPGRVGIAWAGNGNHILNVGVLTVDTAGSMSFSLKKTYATESSDNTPVLLRGPLESEISLFWKGNGNQNLTQGMFTESDYTLQRKLIQRSGSVIISNNAPAVFYSGDLENYIMYVGTDKNQFWKLKATNYRGASAAVSVPSAQYWNFSAPKPTDYENETASFKNHSTITSSLNPSAISINGTSYLAWVEGTKVYTGWSRGQFTSDESIGREHMIVYPTNEETYSPPSVFSRKGVPYVAFVDANNIGRIIIRRMLSKSLVGYYHYYEGYDDRTVLESYIDLANIPNIGSANIALSFASSSNDTNVLVVTNLDTKQILVGKIACRTSNLPVGSPWIWRDVDSFYIYKNPVPIGHTTDYYASACSADTSNVLIAWAGTGNKFLNLGLCTTNPANGASQVVLKRTYTNETTDEAPLLVKEGKGNIALYWNGQNNTNLNVGTFTLQDYTLRQKAVIAATGATISASGTPAVLQTNELCRTVLYIKSGTGGELWKFKGVNYEYANWMGRLLNPNLKFKQITLPGSINAGGAQPTKCDPDFHFGPYLSDSYKKSQIFTVRDQLYKHGARYLDLLLSTNTKSSDAVQTINDYQETKLKTGFSMGYENYFYTCNGEPFDQVLTDVQEFLDNNPNEFVVIKVSMVSSTNGMLKSEYFVPFGSVTTYFPRDTVLGVHNVYAANRALEAAVNRPNRLNRLLTPAYANETLQDLGEYPISKLLGKMIVVDGRFGSNVVNNIFPLINYYRQGYVPLTNSPQAADSAYEYSKFFGISGNSWDYVGAGPLGIINTFNRAQAALTYDNLQAPYDRIATYGRWLNRRYKDSVITNINPIHMVSSAMLHDNANSFEYNTHSSRYLVSRISDWRYSSLTKPSRCFTIAAFEQFSSWMTDAVIDLNLWRNPAPNSANMARRTNLENGEDENRMLGMGDANYGQQVLQVSPNPAGAHFDLTVQQAADIIITDMQGRAMVTRRVEAGLTEIDCRHWNPGIYLVRNTNTGEVVKLLKL